MFCPQCGNDVKDGAKFCSKCGWAVPNAPVQNAQPAEQRCTSCGTVLKEGARFCPNCGGAVSAAAAVSSAPAVPPAPVVSEPVPPSAEAVKADKPEPKKSGAIDKAVFYQVKSRIYACYLYKDGVAVGNMTDTQGAFIPDVKEWLESKYDNIVVEIKDKE